MKRALLIPLLALGLAAGTASAQVTEKCRGETWAQIAERRLGDPRFGAVLAIFNRQPGTERCADGRFARLPIAIKHQVRAGQDVETIVQRFLRGPGGADLVRAHNGLLPGAEPEVGQTIEIPTEVAVDLGKAPEAALAPFEGLVDRGVLLRYNGLPAKKKLPARKTIYVPLFLSPVAKSAQAAAPAPSPGPGGGRPQPPSPEPPPPAEPDGAVAPDAVEPAPQVATPQVANPRRAEAEARFDRFPHAFHVAVLGDGPEACATCHIVDPRRPGAYLEVPVVACAQCHTKVSFDQATAVRTMRLPLAFSHLLHLAPDGPVIKEYGLDCGICHTVAQDGLRRLPGHAECEKCHNPSESKLTVGAHCSGCHGTLEEEDRAEAARALLATHLAQSIRGTNVRFSHDSHVAHLATGGAAELATCDRCHAGARVSESVAEIEPMRMSDCLECHRGLQKIAADTMTRLDECQTCHFSQSIAMTPALTNVIDKPLSHSPRFRKDHGREAEDDDGMCQACHAPLAGGPGQECDRCHAIMRPADHTVLWRDEPHGRAAVRDPERCATCHQRDRCADCHSLAPRDHFPRAAFVSGGHGRRARASVRRCQTCHLPAVDCARCHDVAAR